MDIGLRPIQNIAPVTPLFGLAGQNPAPSYLADGLIEILRDVLDNRDAETWREVAETTEITSNFMQGKQTFQPTTNGWRIQNVRRADPNKISCMNLMQFYVTENLQRIVSSNPDLEPAEEFMKSSYRKTIKRNAAVWNFYEKKFYTTRFNHQEALHAIICGTYLESVQYDQLSAGTTVFQDIWGETQMPISEGRGHCYNCDADDAYESFAPNGGQEEDSSPMPQCPGCGSMDINIEPPVTQAIQSIIAVQPFKTGDLTLKLIPIQCIRFDLHKQAEESSYFLERTMMPTGKLKHILGANIAVESADAGADRGLEALESIARTGNTLFGKHSQNALPMTKNRVLIDRLSLLPEDYHHLFLKSEETVSGEALQKGQRLSEKCPDGLTAVFLNEKHVLGVYPGIHHSQELATGTFHSRLESGIGRGAEDTVEVQKRFNRQDAQMVRAGETGATPAHWYVEGAVDRRHIKQIGMPGTAIPIKQSVASALGKTELVGQLPPSNVAGTFFQYTYEILDKYRQMVSHAPDVTNNLTGGSRRGTATEASISQNNAESLFTPQLQLKASARRRIAQLTIGAFARHFKGTSRYFTIGKTAQNIAVGENVKGEDVDPAIEFVVVADSERPKTRNTQQTAMTAVMQMLGGGLGIVQLKAADPELYSEILKTFDLSLGNDNYDMTEDLCWKRLEQITEAAKQFEQLTQGQVPLEPELLLLALSPQIRPTEPNHPDKMAWFSDFLDTPDGQELSEIERDSIDILIMAHRNGGVLQMGSMMQAAAEAQTMGQQPMVEQQQQMEQGAQQQEAESEQQAMEMSHQQEMEKRAQDSEASDKQMEAENQRANDDKDFEMMQEQGKQQLAMHELETKAELEREKIKAQKAKPKPKPAAKKKK